MTRRAAYIFAEVIHTYAHVNREFQPGASSVSWRNTSFNPSTFLHLCHVLRLLCIYANENARDSFRTAHMEEKGSSCCGDICSPHLCRWWPWSIALGNPRVIYNTSWARPGADSFQLLLRTECSCVDAKEKFYCILQSNRVKDERILQNYSRESGSQEGLGLNPKRMIVKILSSFTRFHCRML